MVLIDWLFDSQIIILVLPFSQWPKSIVLCVFYTLILVSGMSTFFLMLAHFVQSCQQYTNLYLLSCTHQHLTKAIFISLEEWVWLHVFSYKYIYTRYIYIWYTLAHRYTDTRAFKVQNLTSAKSFTQSSLNFLPVLGYVYICKSILKPSN